MYIVYPYDVKANAILMEKYLDIFVSYLCF